MPNLSRKEVATVAQEHPMPSQVMQALAIIIADADHVPVEEVTPSYVRGQLAKAYEQTSDLIKNGRKKIISDADLRASRALLKKRRLAG